MAGRSCAGPVVTTRNGAPSGDFPSDARCVWFQLYAHVLQSLARPPVPKAVIPSPVGTRTSIVPSPSRSAMAGGALGSWGRGRGGGAVGGGGQVPSGGPCPPP